MKLGVPALAGLLLGPAAAAERWDVQYFYDKNDSTLSFVDLQFASAQHGVALGVLFESNRRRPVVVVTANGGRTWDLLPLQEPGRSLFFLNAQTGWMISERGRLWTTRDTGRSWTQAQLKGVRATPLHVFFTDESRGWLLCAQKQVYSTRDGGRSWRLLEASQRPDLPAAQTVYTVAAFQGSAGLLAGWSREPENRSRFPEWMEPDVAEFGHRPTTAVLLFTTDAGQNWKYQVFEKLGQIVRARWSGESALLLVQRPDLPEAPSRIVAVDLAALKAQPVYAEKGRWLTDIAFLGQKLVAVGVLSPGRTPRPAIPARVVALEHKSGGWTEMPVDYRAEARRIMLAVADGAQAWMATDTGMILRLVDR